LYDFLYRDSSRIGSYYAQIFSGRLSSIERAESAKESSDKEGKLTAGFASAEAKITKEAQSGLKHIFDPHDLIASDVLAILTRDKRIDRDPAGAAHGSLILAKGTLVFVDKSLMGMASMALDMVLSAEAKKPKHQRDKESVQNMTILKGLLGGITLPSAFLLGTQAGLMIGGTIKEAGMEEPISTYYFKHGTSGLADVFLVGIKEIPSPAFAMPDQQLFGAHRQAAQALSDMLFPKEAILVTPMAMFRKL